MDTEPAIPDFVSLVDEATTLEAHLEAFAVRAYAALSELQQLRDYPDWTPVDRLEGHLARIARIANGVEGEYAAAPRRLPGVAPVLRVVQ